MPLVRKSRGSRMKGHHSDEDESTPICRCRVLYLGSAVPHITKDGLQGIQEPLKELYPDTGLSSLKGIDSWLSVWSNGLLLENVDEKNTKITRFFPIESLHYCAAVRNVLVPASSAGGSSNEKVQKFLPLDSPFARLPNLNHPPLFACILRRTTGIKVLECHAFICKREMAANALVRCCFHAYADSTYAKQLENGEPVPSTNGYNGATTNGGTMMTNGGGMMNGNGAHGTLFKDPDRPIQRSVTPLDSIEKVAGWQALSQNGDGPAHSTDEDFTDGPISSSTPRNNKYEFSAEFPDEDDIYEGDENHKIWGGGSTASGHNGTSELVYLEPDGTLKSVKSHNSRLTKPRQFISPPPPPPPPPQQFSLLNKSVEDDAASSTKKKTKKKLKKEMKSHQQMQQIQQMQMQQHHAAQQSQGKYLVRPASMMNLSTGGGGGGGMMTPGRAGSVMNGPVSHNRPGSAMSTLTRTRPPPMHGGGHPPHHHMNGYGPPPMMHHPHLVPQPIYGHLPPPGPYGVPQQMMKGSSKSKKKGQKQQQQQILTSVPLTGPMGMVPHPGMHHPGMHHPSATPPPPMYHHHAKMMEDPKGLKHSPELMMLPSHYATIERGYHYHNSARLAMNGGGGGEMMRNGDSSTLISNKSKSKSSSKEETGGSPFNTGIYRKKGHLNERAFSYSIRQEHRSRSYGSLANLQFANESGGPLLRPSGSPPHTAEGMKKEREIIQMVRDLDLSGDEIERSQVPPEFYPSKKANGYHHQPSSQGSSHHLRQPNGVGNHGPRITHR